MTNLQGMILKGYETREYYPPPALLARRGRGDLPVPDNLPPVTLADH